MTKRKPVKQRVPRTRGGGTYTESQFWGFIRAGLRSKYVRWPPRYQTLKAASRPVTGKRHKTEYQCSICDGWYKNSEVEVDHIYACGSLRSFEDLPGFVERLFCEPEGLRVLCKPCHLRITKEAKDGQK